MLRFAFACLLASGLPVAAHAATWNATATNLESVFASARNGDIINATGSFGATWLQNRSFTTRVTLDATNAVFTDTLTIQNVSGLNVLRGTFGSRTAPMRSLRTVIINNSIEVKFQNGTFLGNGLTAGASASHGMIIRESQHVQVSAGNFSNFKTGLGVMSSTNVKVDSSRFNAMTSDGINIVDSRFVTATANTCSGTIPYSGAHPDCIQLWSIFGRPVQSDILLQRNIARGATQGFASFNASDGGGLRITMIGNTVATSFPQGIACYSCVDSVFTDNVISTLPGALYQTTMNIVGGRNNIIANNSIANYIRPLSSGADAMFSDMTDGVNGMNDSIDATLLSDLAPLQRDSLVQSAAFAVTADDDSSLDALAGAVPEPGLWLQLLFGFGLIGTIARRRKPVAA